MDYTIVILSILLSGLILFVYEYRKRKEWIGAELDLIAFFTFAFIMIRKDNTVVISTLAICATIMIALSIFYCINVSNRLRSGIISSIPQNEEEFRKVLIDNLKETKNYIENKGGYKFLWIDDKIPRKEKDIHIFLGDKMESLCKQRNIDMTREAHMGRGLVDFKFSATHELRACLELKLSSNKKLYHGLTKQLPKYMLPNKIKIGIFVVVILKEEDKKKIDKLEEKKKVTEKEYDISIDIITIDAIPKESASKIR